MEDAKHGRGGLTQCNCICIADEGSRPEIQLLEKLPQKVNLLSISCNFDHLSEQELASVDCLLFGAGPMGARSIHLREVFGKLRNLRWIHNLMAGLDPFKFDELLEAKGVTITNSKGVYSQALAEYVMFAAKYFALKTPKLLEHKGESEFDISTGFFPFSFCWTWTAY